MKRLLVSILILGFSTGLVYAESDCYIVKEDALIGNSQDTWNIANMMLKNQEMEKLTKLLLEGKIAVLKENEKVHMLNTGTTLHEIRRANEEKTWFISIEVVKPCPQ